MLKLAVIVVLSVLAMPVCTIAQSSISKATFFSWDYDMHGFKDAKPPSDAIISAILNTSNGRGNKQEIQKMPIAEKLKLFTTVRIDLGDLQEEDYLVLSSFPLTGADCDWYWIVRNKNNHVQVIFFDNTNSMQILKHSTNGYHDLETAWSSAAGYTLTRIFKYDGNRYRMAHNYHKTLKEDQ